MAKQGKVLPARRPRGKESLLIRSAESIGRVIGTLQRQLEARPPRETAHNGSSNAMRPNGTSRQKPAAGKGTRGARVTRRTAKPATKKR
jgi:hypothetical protein